MMGSKEQSNEFVSYGVIISRHHASSVASLQPSSPHLRIPVSVNSEENRRGELERQASVGDETRAFGRLSR